MTSSELHIAMAQRVYGCAEFNGTPREADQLSAEIIRLVVNECVLVCREQMDVHRNETMDVLVGCGFCADAILALLPIDTTKPEGETRGEI